MLLDLDRERLLPLPFPHPFGEFLPLPLLKGRRWIDLDRERSRDLEQL